MKRDYYIRFVCPHCFRSRWVLERNLSLTLQEVHKTVWKFECPVHGPLRGRPFEASEKKPIVREEREVTLMVADTAPRSPNGRNLYVLIVPIRTEFEPS